MRRRERRLRWRSAGPADELGDESGDLGRVVEQVVDARVLDLDTGLLLVGGGRRCLDAAFVR
ncbi:hypothetical protein BpHYR1_052198 [Brachionus plicatilis]|uniref:Uncharacterized protein n=1 Tax=Brachionus plicatilis TaxID=10195 RepID=A0A3M7S4E7_BRAPC|nr:hypothetical protein BpHYR1_052198 [Brachionus plicatilis]